MSYDDFCRCTPEEFQAICEAGRSLEREEWERMRLLATISVQPYAKDRLDPKKLLPFPWDSEAVGGIQKQPAPKLSSEDRRKRFLEVLHRVDGLKQHHIDNLQTGQ